MESFVDLVTTVFQATVATGVVFAAGYIVAGKGSLSPTLDSISRRLLLPAFLFTTLAGSTYLTIGRFLQIVWPSILIAVAIHVPALAYSVVARRYFSSPFWITGTIAFNNVLSYPLLILSVLDYLSTADTGLSHLKWRVLDQDVVGRAKVYLAVNYLLTELARHGLIPLIDRISPPVAAGAEDGLETVDEPHGDEEDATESTPLIRAPVEATSSRSKFLSSVIVAAVLGLLLGLIKPVQRVIFGLSPDYPAGGWLWQTVGGALQLIGAVYAVLDIVRAGSAVREAKHEDPDNVPPTLGSVITFSFWRYILAPLIAIPLLHGLLKIPSTKFLLQDPAFAFTLALAVIGPTTSLNHPTAFQSQVIFASFFTSLITAIPIAAAIAVSGRGISYETKFDLGRALKSAAGGGVAGAAAMVVQVLTLMPMRTIMNYQYRYGGTFKTASKTLWSEGGFKRYYAGLAAALFQGPFSRFGDTAANAGIIALLESLDWPVLVKTLAASFASACFRMVLTPVDTVKTTQQTQGGTAGLKLLRQRIKEKGVGCLWYGALATAAATFVGHYPWFGTYNYLQDVLPLPHTLIQKLLRQAFIGFAASVMSDTISNSLRVVKTYRQVHEGDVGYVQAAKEIVASEGILGLLGRGLATRLLTNGLQGLLFSILWKFFADLIAGHK